MKCSGIIKKLLLAEGFGFIKQENNKPDVFFHKSKNSLFPNLKKGDLVEFDEVSSKKGMAAENISIAEKIVIQRPVKSFIYTKEYNPKFGKALYRTYIETPWFNNPNEGREYLEKAAKNTGCNAVLNLKCIKEARSKGGNHVGTFHSFTADLSTVVEDHNTAKSDHSIFEKQSVNKGSQMVLQRTKNVAAQSFADKEKQDRSYGGYIALVLIALLFLLSL